MDDYEWLNLFRSQRRLRNREIAEIVGINVGTFAQQIAQRKIKTETFEKLKEYARTHPIETAEEIIESGLTPDDPKSIISGLETSLQEGRELLRKLYSSTVKLPLLGCVPAAHFGDSMTEVTEYFEVPAEIAGNADGVIRVQGDCMYPALFNDDIVAIRLTTEAVPGQIVLVRNGHNEVTLKRYKLIEGKPLLVPDNPKYAVLSPDEGTIIGVAMSIVKRVL